MPAATFSNRLGNRSRGRTVYSSTYTKGPHTPKPITHRRTSSTDLGWNTPGRYQRAAMISKYIISNKA